MQSVTITNRDRVIFPGDGFTKGDLADYYEAVAPLMLPFSARRPVSLVRCPQGRAKQCFFQKHDSGAYRARTSTMCRSARRTAAREDYLYVEDAAGIPCLRADGHDRVPRLGLPPRAMSRSPTG